MYECFFACGYLYGQAVLIGRYGAIKAIGIGAVGVVGLVKIQLYTAAGYVFYGEVYIPAAAIGGIVVGAVAEGYEEVIFVDSVFYEIHTLVGMQRILCALYSEGEGAIFPEGFLLAAMRGYHKGCGTRSFLYLGYDTVFRIGWEEADLTGLAGLYGLAFFGQQLFQILLAEGDHAVFVGLGKDGRGCEKQHCKKEEHLAIGPCSVFTTPANRTGQAGSISIPSLAGGEFPCYVERCNDIFSVFQTLVGGEFSCYVERCNDIFSVLQTLIFKLVVFQGASGGRRGRPEWIHCR